MVPPCLSSSSRRPAPPCVALTDEPDKEVHSASAVTCTHPLYCFPGLVSWFAGSILAGSRTKGCILDLLALAERILR
jgi:hypothetical protein